MQGHNVPLPRAACTRRGRCRATGQCVLPAGPALRGHGNPGEPVLGLGLRRTQAVLRFCASCSLTLSSVPIPMSYQRQGRVPAFCLLPVAACCLPLAAAIPHPYSHIAFLLSLPMQGQLSKSPWDTRLKSHVASWGKASTTVARLTSVAQQCLREQVVRVAQLAMRLVEATKEADQVSWVGHGLGVWPPKVAQAGRRRYCNTSPTFVGLVAHS